MKIDSATWSRIAELFDAVVDMPPGDRHRWLDRHAPDGDIRRHLDHLLAAHDTPDPLVVDEAVDELVGRMLGEKASGLDSIPDDLAGRHFGNWRAVEEIGRGGMSVVLRGERADGQFDMTVAIKLLPPGPASAMRRERLQAEIRLLARLEHPGIAHLIDGGVTEEGIPFLVMEHVDGLPITRFCERHGLGLRDRLALLLEVAEALAYSHARLVVHCDIKPSNVLVSREGRVKLVDFGIAAMLSEQQVAASSKPLLRCSPAHAAPEQLRGDPPAVGQDVFALGALLYELISGCRIRDARQTTSVLFGEPLQDDISPPSQVSGHDVNDAMCRNGGSSDRWLRGDLDAICLRALAEDPGQRYSSVDALARDLRNCLESRPVAARGGGRLYRAGKWARRHRWTAAAVSLAVASLLAGSSLAVWQAWEARQSADIARLEAARAETALIESEQALQRAEALREFLVNLFRAAEPDRPREQLPDVEEVLALGARRAMDKGSVPDSERLGMLLAIAQVYLVRHRKEEAEPLLNEAVALARSNRDARPADLARALRMQASLAMMERRPDDAEATLLEAEAVAADQPQAWDAFADARAMRGWIAYVRGEHEQATALLEPLHRELVAGRRAGDRSRYYILNHLAAVYVSTGRIEEAASMRSELTELVKRMEGPESRTYAIDLSNLAVLDLRLGRFDQAMERLEQAIGLFDDMFDDPTEWRAAARANLANAFLYLGREERALQEMEAAAREWAAARDRDPESYEFHFHTRGQMLARMHRWAEAENSLLKADEFFAAQENAPESGRRLNQALLARAHCRQGDVDEGRAVMARLEARLDGHMPANPTGAAEIDESRATCKHYAGDHEAALAAINRALEAVDFTGYVVQRADRLQLRADILFALDRPAEALDALSRAETLFTELDLEDHAAVSRLHAAAEGIASE